MSATPMKIHPLVAAAAGAVIVVSLVGTAALLDWLPGSHGDTDKAPPAVTSAMPTAEKAAEASSEAATKSAKLVPESSERRLAQANPPQHKPQGTATHAPAHAPTQSAAPAVAGMPPQSAPPMPPVSQAATVCAVCGKVLGVRTVEVEAKPSGVGVVAGAVVGGLLGNQVGGGTGKTLATVAGAVGGGYAGNEIEKRTRKAAAWEVDVQFEDGARRSFRYEAPPAWKTGDRVKVVDGALAAR